MEADRFRKAQEIFENALRERPEKRSAFLDEACGDDAEFRREVESLLEHHHDASTEFLRPKEEAPPEAGAEPRARDALIGARIERYTIKSFIGSGGMANVYLAVQEHPRRKVALKLMKSGIASRSALRRFEFESQVLGRLRHANIAQVYEAGTHDTGAGGVPYFAMEYIPRHKPITEYAREHSLSTKERLRLFIKVCEAVHHGHQKGIIHRDLKPGNLLVDSSGEPKVIDFGVARSTDSDLAVTMLQTDVGQLIGTLQYMSPEQCDADPDDLDTRSDVYALGVVLYELLCEQLPYDVTSAAVYEAVRVIREEAPRKPSSINRTLRGDAETITLKAMEKQRDRRYESAGNLARDIQRYLGNEPIEARPPSPVYRLIMLARRRPAVFASVIATLLAIVTAAVLVTAMRLDTLNDELADKNRHLAAARDDLLSQQRTRKAVLAYLGNDRYRVRHQSGMRLYSSLPRKGITDHEGRVAVVEVSKSSPTDFSFSILMLDETGLPLDEPRIERAQVDFPPPFPPDKQGLVNVHVTDLEVCDIFEGNPGVEIITGMRHRQVYPTTIRVHDQNLNPLVDLWHKGGIRALHWDQRTGNLVVLAISNHLDRYFQPLEGLRSDPDRHEIDPTVLFVLRAEDFEHDGDLSAQGRVLFPLEGTPERPLLIPRWTLAYIPPPVDELPGKVRTRLLSLEPSENPEALCRVVVFYGDAEEGFVRPRPGSFSAPLGADGEFLGPWLDEDGRTPSAFGLPDPDFRPVVIEELLQAPG